MESDVLNKTELSKDGSVVNLKETNIPRREVLPSFQEPTEHTPGANSFTGFAVL